MAFAKGKSGNPGGRPKAVLKDGRSVSEIAKEYTEDAIKALVEVLEDTEANHTAKISSAVALLDRGWGRPNQSVDAALTGEIVARVVFKGLND